MHRMFELDEYEVEAFDGSVDDVGALDIYLERVAQWINDLKAEYCVSDMQKM